MHRGSPLAGSTFSFPPDLKTVTAVVVRTCKTGSGNSYQKGITFQRETGHRHTQTTKNKVTDRQAIRTQTHTDTRTQNERWRNDRFTVEVAVVAPRSPLGLTPVIDHRHRALASKRYSFTSSRLCTNQASFHSSGPPALPTLLQYYCTAIGQYTSPARLPFCIPYTIEYW